MASQHANVRWPVFVISYNLLTYVRDTVEFLRNYNCHIHILDNKSTYGPLIDYLTSLQTESNITVHFLEKNYGHRVVFQNQWRQYAVRGLYFLTDPDLAFPKSLPHTFLDDLAWICEQRKALKVGLALQIHGIPLRTDAYYKNEPLLLWESKFWKRLVPDKRFVLYEAEVDTTFCVYNTNVNRRQTHLRLAGPYTVVHRPWAPDYKDSLDPQELEAYAQNNVSSSYVR